MMLKKKVSENILKQAYTSDGHWCLKKKHIVVVCSGLQSLCSHLLMFHAEIRIKNDADADTL